MERPEIKICIEIMVPGDALTFTGKVEKMTVWSSPRGVLRIGEIEFSVSQAATWIESIRPHSVVYDTEFHSMQMALEKINQPPKNIDIQWSDCNKPTDDSEV